MFHLGQCLPAWRPLGPTGQTFIGFFSSATCRRRNQSICPKFNCFVQSKNSVFAQTAIKPYPDYGIGSELGCRVIYAGQPHQIVQAIIQRG